MTTSELNKKKLPKKAIVAELWRRGDLSYKFNPVQEKLHEIFEQDTRRIIPILVSRLLIPVMLSGNGVLY